MSNRNITILIVVTIILVFGVYFYFLYFQDNGQAEQIGASVPKKEEKTDPRFRVTLTGCARVRDRTELRGVVRNTGTVDLRYFTVKSIFKNKDGRIIEIGTIYVIKEKPLKPGESVNFQAMSKVSNVSKCNAEALDWWS